MNLAAVVREHASLQPQKPAILFNEQSICYADLWDRTEKIAGLLFQSGIRRGNRVALCMGDHPLHVMAHYAVARLGAIIVPMDHRWTKAEQQRSANVFDADIVLTDGGEISGARTLSLTDALLANDAAPPPDIDDDDCDLLISLSSGTTGKPKGALVTHRNFYARFKAQWQAIGYGADDCFALLTPLFFGAGRSFAMSMLAAGGTLRLAPPPLKPPQIIKVLKSGEVSATFLPPTLLRRLLPLHEQGAPPLLGNLDFLLVSGEPLFADEARECLRKICPNLYSYYASSEGGGISILRAEDFDEYAETVGKAMPDIDVQIVDADDRVLPTNEVGRLRYRGPSVAERFLDENGNIQPDNDDGWFYPGDLAEILKTGHIALRGRDKDVIIRGGVNIYPAEIERALLSHGDIREAAVLGKEDAERGQVIVAFVAGSSTLTVETVQAWCRLQLAPYKVPQQITIVANLPKRTSGKVDKQALID